MSKILDKIKKFSMFKERDDEEYVSWLDPDSEEGKSLLKDTKKALKGELEPEGDISEENKRILLQAQQEVSKLQQNISGANSAKQTNKAQNPNMTFKQGQVATKEPQLSKTEKSQQQDDKDIGEI